MHARARVCVWWGVGVGALARAYACAHVSLLISMLRAGTILFAFSGSIIFFDIMS